MHNNCLTDGSFNTMQIPEPQSIKSQNYKLEIFILACMEMKDFF